MYVVMRGWIKSAATHYIMAKYPQRGLYQLPVRRKGWREERSSEENNRRRPATAKGLARAQMQYGGDRGEIRAISTSYECYNFL